MGSSPLLCDNHFHLYQGRALGDKPTPSYHSLLPLYPLLLLHLRRQQHVGAPNQEIGFDANERHSPLRSRPRLWQGHQRRRGHLKILAMWAQDVEIYLMYSGKRTSGVKESESGA